MYWVDQIIRFFLYISFFSTLSTCYYTGFWYGQDRPPDWQYETVPYANLTLRIMRPFQEGPGQNLVSDPIRTGNPLYVGNTINRQTFDTQFVLDLSYALGIDVHRIMVIFVSKGTVHFDWESSSVIVNFIFLERNDSTSLTLLEAIAELTTQIQTPNSTLYKGTNVTKDIDPLYGLQVVTWDVSLKLTYPISIIGGSTVKDGYYLDYGGLGVCDGRYAANFSKYCEFERFFEDDVSKALNISYFRVQILFIKSAALDASLVSFRISPEMPGSKEDNVTAAISNLLLQVNDMNSPLYAGNVTVRTDPTWGVSQFMPRPRTQAPLFTYRHYEYDISRLQVPQRSAMITPYDRCKANRRCNWGEIGKHLYIRINVLMAHNGFNFSLVYL